MAICTFVTNCYIPHVYVAIYVHVQTILILIMFKIHSIGTEQCNFNDIVFVVVCLLQCSNVFVFFRVFFKHIQLGSYFFYTPCRICKMLIITKKKTIRRRIAFWFFSLLSTAINTVSQANPQDKITQFSQMELCVLIPGRSMTLWICVNSVIIVSRGVLYNVVIVSV